MTKNERVKALRNELRLSQAMFGKKLKISQRAVSLIESGINNLSPRNFDNICQIFNVNPQWLESGEYPIMSKIRQMVLVEIPRIAPKIIFLERSNEIK